MNYGFDYKKYYIVTEISVHYSHRNSCIGFVKYPDSEDKELLRHKDMVMKEVEKVESSTGAKFCHLCFYSHTLPHRFILIFDMGLQDKNFINKMKMKIPHMVEDIRPDDDSYIVLMKNRYETMDVYEHDGFTAFTDATS